MEFFYEVDNEKRLVSDEVLNPFEFRGRMGEAVAWSMPHAAGGDDPVYALRSEAMKPYSADTLSLSDLDTENQVAAINLLLNKRSQLIELEQLTIMMPTRKLSGGQLVLYLPESTENIDPVDGLFSVDGTPPWGTWVFGGLAKIVTPSETLPAQVYLIAWIPPVFLDLAEEGVETHSALHWIERFEPGF